MFCTINLDSLLKYFKLLSKFVVIFHKLIVLIYKISDENTIINVNLWLETLVSQTYVYVKKVLGLQITDYGSRHKRTITVSGHSVGNGAGRRIPFGQVSRQKQLKTLISYIVANLKSMTHIYTHTTTSSGIFFS